LKKKASAPEEPCPVASSKFSVALRIYFFLRAGELPLSYDAEFSSAHLWPSSRDEPLLGRLEKVLGTSHAASDIMLEANNDCNEKRQ